MGQPPTVYVLSGPMAAGKSTVARLLAARFERGVHLEGDMFRRAIAGGRQEMTPDPSEEALAQLRLRYRLAAAAADGYVDAGFTVVLEDVIARADLARVRTLIRARPCHVFVLFPDQAEIRRRESGRAAPGYGQWTVEGLYATFAATPRIGIWLDTTDLTPDETVEAILAAAPPPPTPIPGGE